MSRVKVGHCRGLARKVKTLAGSFAVAAGGAERRPWSGSFERIEEDVTGAVEVLCQVRELLQAAGGLDGAENLAQLGGAVESVETIVLHRGQEVPEPAGQPLAEEIEPAGVQDVGLERRRKLVESSTGLLEIEQNHALGGMAFRQDSRPLELLVAPVFVFDRRPVFELPIAHHGGTRPATLWRTRERLMHDHELSAYPGGGWLPRAKAAVCQDAPFCRQTAHCATSALQLAQA